MSPSVHESTVSLENLDGHLKALLRLKIREFGHLSPWFKNDGVVDRTTPASSGLQVRGERPPVLLQEEDCPHRKHDGRIGRRHVRSALRLKGLV